MDTDSERRLNLTNRYLQERGERLEYAKEYYQKHKDEIKKKARNRYRIKCGLRLEK